jgi:hypothetical protein
MASHTMFRREATAADAPFVMTPDQAAKALGKSLRTLDNWRTRPAERPGDAPPYFKLGHLVRYRRCDVRPDGAAREAPAEMDTVEAARYLNVRERTLKEWRWTVRAASIKHPERKVQCRVPFHRRPDGTVFYKRGELDEFIAARLRD